MRMRFIQYHKISNTLRSIAYHGLVCTYKHVSLLKVKFYRRSKDIFDFIKRSKSKVTNITHNTNLNNNYKTNLTSPNHQLNQQKLLITSGWPIVMYIIYLTNKFIERHCHKNVYFSMLEIRNARFLIRRVHQQIKR